MKKIIFPVLLLFFTAFIISCGEENKKETSQSSDVDMFETKSFIDKYNAYIDFGNSFDKSVVNSYDRYFSWTSREEGPSSSIKTVRGVSTLSDYQLKQLEKAINNAPDFEELDPEMKVVLENANALKTTLDKADSYYSKQDYKDDDFAKGKELHKEIVKSYDNYFNSYDKMYITFKALQNDLKTFEANKFKENGQLIRYNLMLELNKIEEIFALIGNKDGEELKTIDLNVYKTKIKEFREIHEKLEKLSNDEEQKTKEFGEVSMAKSSLSGYLREANNLIREFRNLQERIEKSDFDYGIVHPNIPANGSPLKLRKVYSNLITNYNRMN